MPRRKPRARSSPSKKPRLKLVRGRRAAPKAAATGSRRRVAPAKAPGKVSAARPVRPGAPKARPHAAAHAKPGANSKLAADQGALRPKGASARPPALALVPRSKTAPAPPRAAAPAGRVPRDELLARYTPLIRYVVERLAVGLPRNVDHEDLVSAGVMGLLDAYEKFDSSKGTKFETYAVWRIKGAVLDQLRSLDWASRSVRRRAREVEATTRRLDQKFGRAATDQEIALAAKMPLAEYHRLMDQVRGAVLLSLDEVRSPEDGDSLGLAETIEDPSAPDVLARLEEEETRQMLLDTLNRLPEQERLVVALYYYEHMTLREIGLTLGISESRVSQVHSRAVQRLRGRVRRTLACA